jgi:Na+/H+ antiporter NhaD/arsenite permease-like protein
MSARGGSGGVDWLALRLQCRPMNDTRRLTPERGLFAGALVIGAAAVGLGVPVEFALFGLMLAGIALLHEHPLQVALTGLAVIVAYKLAVTGFDTGSGLTGLALHVGHEGVTLANLLGLLLGFALLAQHFEDSHAPTQLPKILPSGAPGAFLLLALVFVLSSFLDNIAAALIGGAMARAVFRGRVHIGYLAAIVAASNAGGSGSVVGDTTTTMMWIDGVTPLEVVHAYTAAVPALLICGLVAALQQQRHAPLVKDNIEAAPIDWPRIGIVLATLLAVITANVVANLYFPAVPERVPVVGLAAFFVIVLLTPVRRPSWTLLPGAFKNSAFLLALVLCASLMPVEQLPVPSWQTALGLGFVSAVFDNIPLTALALAQGH